MEVKICRESVCMADDVEEHAITYTIHSSTKFSEIFQDLIRQKYFPSISGNDVVWALFCGEDDLISWKTKEDILYHRFVDGEPAILSINRWTTAAINFRYYSPPLKRAEYLFKTFGGSKFHIWHEGFMAEYESYHIPTAVEEGWSKES